MSVTVRQFKNEFPEFRDTDEALVQSRLNMAVQTINPTVWGTRTDTGVKWKAAKLLARTVFGEQARLKAQNRSTIYDETYNDLLTQVASGHRLI